MLTTMVQRKGFLAAAGLVAAAVLLLASCGGDDYGSSGDGSVSGGDEEPAAGGGDNDAGDAVSSDGSAAGEADSPSIFDRKIVRTATISLSVEDVTDGMRQVEDIATIAGGFVSRSSIATDVDDDSPQVASITIRVPAERYGDVVNDLRGIATNVRSESIETGEVTEEYTDLQSRLRNLEATEAQYLALLTQAQSIDDILTVQDRLNIVRGEIEQVTGRINALDDLTELATINVDLQVPAAGATGASKNWATSAWETSWEASKDAAVVFGTVGIALAFVALWVVPVGLVGFVIWRFLGRPITEIVTRLNGSPPRPPSTTAGSG